MYARRFWILVFCCGGCGTLLAQNQPIHLTPLSNSSSAQSAPRRSPAAQRPAGNSAAMLPNDHGQVWRQYDLRGYTNPIQSVTRPQQAVVDWVLRETGNELWFGEPVSLLSANHDTLSVYHTPEMQRIVAGVVDRLVRSQGRSYVFSMQLLTVGSPNWRNGAVSLMRTVNVQSAGVDAWLLSKENAAILLANLSKRHDFRRHNSPHAIIPNGQTHELRRLQPKSYVHGVNAAASGWPGHELERAEIQEGYTLEFSPLVDADEKIVDAVLRCSIDQVEKFVPVHIDLPTAGGGSQRVEIQVPQVVSWRLHERFRWPADRVLLLSCGVIASPGPSKASVLGIPNPFGKGGRADALLMIEFKGRPKDALVESAKRTETEQAPRVRRY